MNEHLIPSIVISLFFSGLMFIGLQIILPNSMFNRWQWKRLLEAQKE